MNGALDGIRVLDLSRVLAGPFCTMILGDLGADVLKVERPGVGDDLRGWGPPFGPTGDSAYFLGVNRNKRSIAVDFRSEAGRELIVRLAAQSDVVVENFRLGQLDALGIGYDVLKERNPGLVFASITAYGQTGPWAQRPGYDVMIQAMGGLMSVTGEPDGQPMRVGVAIVDLCTGLYAAVGILAALQARARTGKGQRVDLSLIEAVLASLPNLTAGYLIAGDEPQRLGTRHPNVTPYGVFPTKDKYIVIAVGNDQQWRRLCTAVGEVDVADDPRYASNDQRLERRAEIEQLVSKWCARFTAGELSAALTNLQVPHGPVNSIPEALNHEQLQAIGVVQEYPLEDGSSHPMVRSPLSFSIDQRTEHLPPPGLGTATEPILLERGFSIEEIRTFAREGAFGSQ